MSTPAKSDPAAAVAVMERIVSLCKRRGFIFQSSEIYGGIGGFWDYGPLGAELKRNLREAWWRAMTRDREDVLGLDATIIMNPAIWVASGHTATFADMMRECRLTNKRVRADHVAPQDGMVYHYSGARSQDDEEIAQAMKAFRKHEELSGAKPFEVKQVINERDSSAPISIMIPFGKPKESADKIAIGFYSSRGVNDPLLSFVGAEKVEGSVDFHPETGGLLREARPFNLMLKTYVGPTATEADVAYLRPETAQAIFVQFKNVLDSSRQKMPFGICQIGKAFRNEVTPKNFTFRSREFEQMELEFFIKPDEAIEIICGEVAQWSGNTDLSEPRDNWGWDLWHRYWVSQQTKFYASIGLGGDLLDYYHATPEDLAHYARACVDILFKFPFGTDELEGIAARGDFDLTQHQKHSGKSQEYFDEELKAAAAKLTDAQKEALIQKRLAAEQSKVKGAPLPEADVCAWFERLFKGFYLPHVIEPSAGLDRLALAIICAAFAEEEKADVNGKVETRTFLRFHPRIAPVKVGVFPLLKNKPELVAKAREVYALLKKHHYCFYDEAAAIGRRYARQDEAGTPFGVTIDFETLGEKGPELQDTVTVRERDTAAQHRVKIADLPAWLAERM